jgi:diamine N-acetyltransferase
VVPARAGRLRNLLDGTDGVPDHVAVAVHLREITPENRAAVEALAVGPEQDGFVGTVTVSLREAAETPQAAPWYRAVYDDDTPVGFVMISDGSTPENMKNPELLGPYFLWRLLVDQHHQKHGYGAAALSLVVDHLRTHRPDAQVLLTSCGQGPNGPLGFYARQGFRVTGQFHDGEVVLELPLEPSR